MNLNLEPIKFLNMKWARSFQMVSVGCLAFVGVNWLSGCTAEKHSEPNVELIQDMMDQPALKAQDYQPSDVNAPAGRLPPEGTVPVDFKVYAFHNDPTAAEKNLKNPIAGEMSPAVLDRGRSKFNTYCMVCHGPTGHGDGPVAAKMQLKPPSLMSDKVRGFTDGRLFHIITDGQGVMSSYAFQLVDERDRWCIVNYVRNMQKSEQK